MFGTLADLDRLVEEAGQRGIRIILDLVPNHTSDQHPWFLDARTSRESPYHDWYIWHPGKPDGSPPNNWRSVFGGPAWSWNEATREYYYHAFLPQQPDLDWRNPEVREEMYDTIRFWFDRGIAGFRIDVAWHLVVDTEFRDNPPNPRWDPATGDGDQFLPVYTSDLPEVATITREMRQVADEYGDSRVLIGEIYLPFERLVTYYGEDGGGLHQPYNFSLLLTPWSATAVSEVVNRYEGLLPSFAWPNWVLGNHDRPRTASRLGPRQARVAAVLLFTLRGTPTLYYGDELGMQDAPISPERMQDPIEATRPGGGRDPERTPMQWDGTPGAGFTSGGPWLPLAQDFEHRNVAAQRDDSSSMLTLHRRLIALRAASPGLLRGPYRFIEASGSVFLYERGDGDGRWIVAANFGAAEAPVRLPGGTTATLMLSTHLGREGEAWRGMLRLRGDEAIVARVE
jgi:alpha-glucosidase